MSNSTFLGLPEVVWTAFEAIGTILAFSLTFILLLAAKIRKPNLTISDLSLRWEEGFTQPNIPPYNLQKGGRKTFPNTLSVSWRVHNKQRLIIFGKEVTKLQTTYWLEKESEGDWVYQGNLDPIPFLPINGEWPQHKTFERANREEGTFFLTLHFTTDGLPIGSCHKEILFKKSE